MDIILGRLDNRLLHGIIATQWVQHTACERLMIIDDEVALDSQKKGYHAYRQARRNATVHHHNTNRCRQF